MDTTEVVPDEDSLPEYTIDYKVGFIGGGNMARAIGISLINKNVLDPQNVWVSAKTLNTLDMWENVKTKCGVNTTYDNAEVVRNSDIIFLTVKPQALAAVLNDIKNMTKTEISTLGDKLFISVLAGITIKTLEHEFNKRVMANICSVPLNIIRTMPNMPLRFDEGITVYSRNDFVPESGIKLLVDMLSNISMVEEIPEYLMNTAGGLAASGPAYAYLMIEALADGAVKNGLPREMAIKFAAQVLVGAGKMVMYSGQHPAQLKDEVCSAGGTTICGIQALEAGAVRASLMNAVEAAIRRANEIGN